MFVCEHRRDGEAAEWGVCVYVFAKGEIETIRTFDYRI